MKCRECNMRSTEPYTNRNKSKDDIYLCFCGCHETKEVKLDDDCLYGLTEIVTVPFPEMDKDSD